MIFVPSQEIHDRLHFELAGVFIDRALTAPHRWLVAKLPTNVIREVRAGAALSLKVWLVAIDDHTIPVFGLTVYDDVIAPRTFFGSCRNDAEADDLWAVLAAGVFPIQFHNENCAPLLYAEGRVDPEAARAVMAKRLTPAVPGDRGFELRERANDVVEASLQGGDDRILAACDLRVVFTQTHTIRVLFPELGEVDLTDSDEGGELERLTFRAFESLFPFGTFINPRVGEGAKRRELCDVLAVARVREVGNEGVFVVQNKVASAFTEGLKRTTARRAKSIQKNILAGIGQLGGGGDQGTPRRASRLPCRRRYERRGRSAGLCRRDRTTRPLHAGERDRAGHRRHLGHARGGGLGEGLLRVGPGVPCDPVLLPRPRPPGTRPADRALAGPPRDAGRVAPPAGSGDVEEQDRPGPVPLRRGQTLNVLIEQSALD